MTNPSTCKSKLLLLGQFSSRMALLPPPSSRKTLTMPEVAKGELVDRTSELPPLSVPSGGGQAVRPHLPDVLKRPVVLCQPLSACPPPQPHTCRGREGMRVGRHNVHTVEGQVGARRGQTAGAREHVCWGRDGLLTRIHSVGEDGSHCQPPRRHKLTMEQSALHPGSSCPVRRPFMRFPYRRAIVGASSFGQRATLLWETDSS